MLPITKSSLRDLVLHQIEELDWLGRVHYGPDAARRITRSQEAAYRLCHQDFCGLPITEAAEVLETTERSVRRLLADLKQIAPQLFPILSPRAARIYELYMSNHTTREIAESMDRSVRSVQAVLHTLKRKASEIGLYFSQGQPQRSSFEPWMESEAGIREWF